MTLSLSLATFLSTKLSFNFLFSSASRAHPSQERLLWTEGICTGEASLPGLRINAKRAGTRKYVREPGLRINGKRASTRKYVRNHVQVRLAVKGGLHYFFNIISCGLHSRAVYNRANTVYQKDQRNSLLFRLHKAVARIFWKEFLLRQPED